MRIILSSALFLFAALAACSGSTSSPTGDAGRSGDGSGSGGSSGSGSGSSSGGGTCRAGAPTVHRPSASACPSHTSDAGADSGVVGCMPPHDACLVDSDCGSTGVCDCEAPRCAEPFAVAGNVCLLNSDCHVDSDCACGYCAGDTSCGGLQAYHCTTTHDECSTDADCQDGGTLTQCRWSTDHWACVEGMGCPG